MLFHSIQFLVLLSVTFACYWAVAKSKVARLSVLLLASVAFYAAWDVRPVAVFVWYAAVNTLFTAGFRRWAHPRMRKALLALTVVNHLSVLGLYKYADLFLATWGWLGERTGLWAPPALLHLLLPVGLSFVAFQAISYAVDVYRGHVEPKHGFLDQLVFTLFFPQLVAGPIVRADALLERFDMVPWLTVEAGGRGLYRIAMGIAKKLLVADVLAVGLVDPVFANISHYTSAECAVAVFAYTFQIYFDFSAYSDIAIGAAALFGFQLPENFNKPYRATSLFEFWNRWHISFSTWLRDYFYIPLGGNRVSKAKVLRNLFLVMALGGLWHGADWKFLLWGALHGALLVVWRLWWWVAGKPRRTAVLRAAAGFCVTLFCVVFARIFFRAHDMAHATAMFDQLLRFTPGLANVSTLVWVTLVAAVASHYLPDGTWVRLGEWFTWMPAPLRAAALIALGLVIRRVASIEAQPYVYFQF
jgi:D-alanyl-lipoteichoic acid acyltransferase DltB (MBOAT superfamily)